MGISHDEFSERERVVSRSISPSQSGEGTAIKILARLHEFLEESDKNTRHFSVWCRFDDQVGRERRNREEEETRKTKSVGALITPFRGGEIGGKCVSVIDARSTNVASETRGQKCV